MALGFTRTFREKAVRNASYQHLYRRKLKQASSQTYEMFGGFCGCLCTLMIEKPFITHRGIFVVCATLIGRGFIKKM